MRKSFTGRARCIINLQRIIRCKLCYFATANPLLNATENPLHIKLATENPLQSLFPFFNFFNSFSNGISVAKQFPDAKLVMEF